MKLGFRWPVYVKARAVCKGKAYHVFYAPGLDACARCGKSGTQVAVDWDSYETVETYVA